MLSNTLLLTASNAVQAVAWTYHAVNGVDFSGAPTYQNATVQQIFDEQLEHPTLSKSVPVKIGTDSFTFRVNTTIITPYGVDTDVDKPLAVITQYELLTPGGANLNSSVRSAEQLGDDQTVQLCANIFPDLFSTSTTNDYEEDDNGDCSGALGNHCTNALMNSGYGYVPGDESPMCNFILPDECRQFKAFGDRASSSLTQDINPANDTGIYPFAYRASPLYSSGDGTYYARESERLHVVVFTGRMSYPVCLRLKDDHLKRGSPASTAAKGIPWASNAYLGLAGALAVVAFLV